MVCRAGAERRGRPFAAPNCRLSASGQGAGSAAGNSLRPSGGWAPKRTIKISQMVGRPASKLVSQPASQRARVVMGVNSKTLALRKKSEAPPACAIDWNRAHVTTNLGGEPQGRARGRASERTKGRLGLQLAFVQSGACNVSRRAKGAQIIIVMRGPLVWARDFVSSRGPDKLWLGRRAHVLLAGRGLVVASRDAQRRLSSARLLPPSSPRPSFAGSVRRPDKANKGDF